MPSLCVTSEVSSADEFKIPVTVDGLCVKLACDTGASCSLAPLSWLKKCKKQVSLTPCTTTYVGYGGNKIKTVGLHNCKISYCGTTKNITFVVTNCSTQPLLGRDFLSLFNFRLEQICAVGQTTSQSVIIDEIKNQFAEVFNGQLGSYKSTLISLPISENAKPVFCKPRPTPFAWKKSIEENLNQLIKNDILEPINNSDWGTPLVPVLKPNGEIRICGDYKTTINKYLHDYKYPLPRIEEIFTSLEGGELFTKLDLSNAYNQLILDEKSQLLCTWSTHLGTFKMKRMPFGIKPAASIFQKTVETLLCGIPYVVVYQDDITISGKNLKQHLLQKNTKFVWSEQCQDAYECIKKDITSDQVLTHFDPELPIILTTDASNSAVAGVLSHEFSKNDCKPIAFVSRALTKCEQNYSTLEKEALAIIFCVSKLKQYLHGNNFILRTDHKPFISIFNENKG
ncbi:uncharacterized protein K02A2.6-like [Teleopsis dalmanni]|uniref:uncharacterized protein K02A2.6-like n=2 Tax=Teleopsis dalmanni TaxID=139649 RepID=UPI0018CD14C8|nr:uncharacterized protein K02A2.6-like [Teleopsis dalmanni]XP_037932716.1 uncharacterized protein K02A2.6-like [Teleopsis dalmanni]